MVDPEIMVLTELNINANLKQNTWIVQEKHSLQEKIINFKKSTLCKKK